ncbi:conserved hypothetical protein [Leishmania major strain Friedlin]|uniref:Uncharacterized protein n=1 Tax=Leishmania major TaxID=5664 RepID=Q4QEB4_LEIMA|nr:conserved hypothetical protein [Leishmania major strain Friedlin]CAG9572309.1 hypothetical_protein_-_conserved [Leishmania major strain Friedlin]CAJ03663.1 conserved hypothetical protein [Leishmania major strain Friedlin]|eukprot:XP_001682334.1 conserved hypothetical protein [Leishmania major strain Friedlin]
MPPPTPPAPSPRTVYDIVKSHIQLPINRDYNALKRVLRDWLAYSTHTPLQEKPTFTAELVITITRMPPETLSTIAQGAGGISGAAVGKAHSARGGRRWWPLWGTREDRNSAGDPTLAAKVAGAASSSAPAIPPYVYRKVVPLHVWTAVLPWEMQRGLSFSDLRLPQNMSSSRGAESDSTASSDKTAADPRAPSDIPVRPPQQRQQGAAVYAEEEDPYGVVTPPIAFGEGNSASAAAAALARAPLCAATTATAAAAPTSSLSITPVSPAMLFLTDIRSTKAHGIGFWSGAIRQAVDVLFVGPTLPRSVGDASASFRQLRQQEGFALVMENKISSEVLHRFFPLQEIRSPSSSAASASSATFRVHSFGHLDPLPPSLHPSRLGVDDWREEYRGLSFTVAPDAPYNTPEEAPRYVFEVPRHTLRPAVAAALKESRSAHQELLHARDAQGRTLGKAATPIHDCDATGSKLCRQADDDVSIDLVVNLSPQLRADLFSKAQLCVEYVSLLEEAVAHYARMLNTDTAAAAEVPLDERLPSHADAGAGAGAGSGRRMKVWLSEHEFRWMTPEELKQASEAEAATEQQAQTNSSIHADQEGVFQESREEAAAVTQTKYNDVAVVGAAAEATLRDTAASAVAAQSARPGAVSAARSISLQSPILRCEEEGCPSYLAPSFVGRHEAPALQSSVVVLSADKLARYPRTHSHMQELPPVDYELYELCMRLGVGQQSVLYHYHERILHEWRRELHRLRQQQKACGASEPPHVTAPSRLAKEDVQRMVGLVRDRSLQLPSDMVSLVEAVAAAM